MYDVRMMTDWVNVKANKCSKKDRTIVLMILNELDLI